MAELRYAEIRFKDRVAGNLTETPDGGTVFEYSQPFNETIACALPRDQDRHAWDTGLHPFFEHLGPEGWLRNRQTRTAEIAIEDDFGLLLEYGADCIGAVSVHDPTGGDLNTGGRTLDRLTQAAVQSKRTISGVQPKILVTKKGDRYFPAEQEDPALYIAKFPSDDLPNLVSNEDFSLRLARLFLGSRRVTKAQRALVDGIETPALIVERFDRTGNNEKLRLEDFAQILRQPKRRDFSGKYEGSFEQIADAIRSYSALPEIDIQLFFQMLIAFAVLGNCDCHLKNFSLLETPRGLRLAPAYDVVNTYIYGKYGYSTRFGLRLLGEAYPFDQLNRDVFSRFGRVIGLNQIAIEKTIDDIGGKQDKVLALIGPNAAVEQNGLFADYEQCLREALVRICGSNP